MGLLDKILGKSPTSQNVIDKGQTFKFVTGYEPVFRDWRGEIYESMLVRAAIDARSRHISKLMIEFEGTAKPDLTARLRKRPNPWDTWSQFLYRTNTILDATNNCLLVPIFDDGLNKIGFYPILATAVKIVEYKGELWIKYKFRSNRLTAACKLSECAILRKYQFRSDFFGESNAALDDTMDLISMQKQGIKEAIKTTASYKFMAVNSNFALQKDLEAEQKNFSERNFSAEAKGSKVLLFPNTYKDVKQIDLKPYTPDDKQMALIRANVYEYFGVNEDVLTNKAYGDAWSAFYEGVIEPFAVQFSEVMTKMLFTFREQASGSRIAATANRLQYMTNKDKLDVSAQMMDRGLMTRNEIREIWNLPPVDGGDEMMIRAEYVNANERTENDET
mgnify:CR=1 FL=1